MLLKKKFLISFILYFTFFGFSYAKENYYNEDLIDLAVKVNTYIINNELRNSFEKQLTVCEFFRLS